MALLKGNDSSPDLLEAAAKGVALAVALLPASGFLLRWVAFGLGTHLTVSSEQLAWSAPVPQLAVTGFAGMFPWALLTLGLPLLAIWANRQPLLKKMQQRTALDVMRNPRVWGGYVGGLVIAGLLLAWPSTFLGALTGLFLGNFASWLADKPFPLKLRHLWPIVAVGVLSAALLSGIGGRVPGIQVGEYNFTAQVSNSIPDGSYAELAESADRLYLLDCRGTGQVVGVSKASVASIHFTATKLVPISQPSLVGVLFRNQRTAIGFRYPC